MITTPVEVNDLSLAFGGDMKKLLPPMDEIPEEFHKGKTRWNDLVGDWFFRGIKGTTFTPKEGIDTDQALRHVQAVLGSWEPSHEHKEAGCAYLMSLFFQDYQRNEENK